MRWKSLIFCFDTQTHIFYSNSIKSKEHQILLVVEWTFTFEFNPRSCTKLTKFFWRYLFPDRHGSVPGWHTQQNSGWENKRSVEWSPVLSVQWGDLYCEDAW